MKKKLLALLLAFLMLVNLVPPDVFAATASGAESAAITIPACSGSPTCWGTVNGDPIHNHVDGCARKDYLKDYVTSSTAADIAAVWSGFTAEEQADILLMVQAYTGYIDELKALVDTGTTPEPELPSVSTTVTVDGVEQTVTVKGETLPEGAKLAVTPVADESQILTDIGWGEHCFIWDVSITDSNNNVWEPSDDKTVSVSFPVNGLEDGTYLQMYHLLETPEAVSAAIAAGTARESCVDEFCSSFAAAAAPAIAAYQQVTGSEDDTFVLEIIPALVEHGIATASASSFSVWLSGGVWQRYSNESSGNEVVVANNGGVTYYAALNEVIYLDTGAGTTGAYKWRASLNGTTTDSGNLFSYTSKLLSNRTNNQARLNLSSSNVKVGDTINVWFDGSASAIKGKTVTFIVVNEVGVTLNENRSNGGGGSNTLTGTTPNASDSNTRYYIWYGSTVVSYAKPPQLGNDGGYKHVSWNTAADGSGTSVAINSNYAPSSATTLYAQWDPIDYTLSFNANGGSVSPASKTVTYDSAYGDLPTPSRTNYRFLGWYTAASGGTQVTSATVHKTAGNTTIYAHWTWDVQITNTYDGYLRPAGATPASYKWYRDSASYVNKTTTWNNSWTAVSSSNLSGNNVNVLKDKGYVQEDSSTVSGDAVSGIKYRYRLDALDSSGNVIGSAYYTVNFGDHILNSSFEAPYQGPKTCMGYVYNQENIFWSSTVTGEIHSGRPWDIELVGSESAGFSNKIAFDGDQYAEINANAAAALYQDVITEPNSYFGWSLSHSCRLTSGTDTMYVLIAPSTTARFVETQDELDILINNAKSVADAAATEEAKADVMSGETQLTATVDGQTVVYRIWEISSAFNDATTWTLHSGNYYVPAGQQMTRFFFAAGETAATAQGNTTTGDTIGNLVDSVSFADKIYYTVNYYLDGKLLPQYGESGGGDAGDVIYSNSDTINAILNNGATMLQSVYLNNTYQAVSDQPSMTLAENRANNLHLNFASNYTLTFNFNGSGRADSSYTVTYNSSNYYEVNWLKPVRDGHSFDGWFTQGGVQVYSDDGYCLEGDYWDSNNRWIGSSDLTVYAHWTPLPYTVTWVDGNGKTLKTDSVLYGEMPSYSGATPTKKADAQYTYTFNGTWSPAISAVTGNATYTAQFDRTVNKYTVTWVNHDGSILETDTNVPYGTNPSYDGATPTKPADSEYTYKWVGWNPTVSAVTGNVIYVASYDRTPIPYTITWVDGDGKTLKTESYYSNDIPSYTGATPTKKATDQYTYTFNGKWSPAIEPVTGDATYTAQFDSEVNEYTVTWVDGDGKTLKTEKYGYGDTPAYTGATPTKKATDQYTYTFNGKWSPAIADVTGDATYTAQFDSAVNEYTVTWVDGDGKTLKTEEYEYGKTPSYTGTAPTKKADAQYTYAWNGTWSPDIEQVTGDATYTAQFDKTVNSYTVTWVDGDGKILKTEEYDYGDTPIYTGTTPTKKADAQYTYTWSNSWSPAISAVTGDATYTAQFGTTINKYAIIWVDGDGKELMTESYEYGDTPAYTGVTPTKKADAQYTYTFNGKWSPEIADVTGKATYTAQFDKTVNTYTVTWVNYDGSVLETDNNVPYGEEPSYDSATPVKPATAQYTYTWSGWDPVVSDVTGDVTYTAQFDSEVNTYTVTWVDGDGKTLKSDTHEYGEMPSYSGATPTKKADAQYTYTFNGTWSPAISAVTGDATYTAQFDSTINKYTVTWVNYDGSILETDTDVPYGTDPSYDGAAPTQPADGIYTYEWMGWEPTVSKVTGNVIYTASYNRLPIPYTVTWVDGDGKTLKTDTHYSSQIPSYTGATPTKKADAQYTYTFNGTWSPAIEPVTGDATYTAQFDKTVNTYTVTWVDGDGKTLKTDTLEYGDTPAYAGATPTKKTDAQYTYSFNGKWSPEIADVTGDATYTAQFDKTVNTYTVTWVNYDGSILETDNNVPYGNEPSYDGATPVKPATAQYTYTWSGWDPVVSDVTGDVTYTAQFGATVNTYTVTWVDGDGKTLKTDTLEYGDTPAYTGATPTKKTDAQYTYTWDGTWSPAIVDVIGDATYTAQFGTTVNKYTVTWVNYDGSILETDNNVPYGNEPSYDGATPVKPADAQYTYIWSGWDPAVSDVTGDVTYTAQFGATVNTYTVTWVDGDGKTLKTDTLEYGDTPAYTGATPTKKATDQYTYTFNGTWSPAIVDVTGDATYTAQFDSEVNSYTVTWVDGDGKTLMTESYDYGATPAYTGATPTKKADAQYTYTWDGTWSPAIVAVTGDATYTAQFGTTVNTYTVTWVNYDGSILETDTDVPYGTDPSYDGAAPTQPADGIYTYEWMGWEPTVSKVTGNVIYAASYNRLPIPYTVTWVDGDGKTLKTDTYYSSQIPSYTGATPTKKADAQYTYTFNGTWSPAIEPVTGDATYTAQFDKTVNSYTVTWVDGDGKTLGETVYEYGDTPTYTGATPTKKATAQYTYTFNGTWSPAIVDVTGDATYTAQFDSEVNSYTVTWVDGDGKTLGETVYKYGDTPAYTGATPTKKADAQYTYTFNGTWSPAIEPVTGDATYTAQFDSEVNSYTVTWVDGDGKTLGETVYKYGDTPAYTGATPTKKADAQYTYTWDGTWSPAIVDVTGDATYTAQFDAIVNQYTVTWVDGDGKTLMTESYDYGDTPAYTGATPTKKATAQYTYTFNGTWSPEIETVTEDATYTAQFGATVNTYTVTWVDGDSKTLKTDTLEYGDTPAYTGATPTKSPDAQYTYTWDGTWSPAISTVTGDATYTAQFKIATADLTIEAEGADASHSYIFTVTQIVADPAQEAITMKVVVVGNSHVTIKGLPVATYEVKEVTQWSWRQADVSAQTVLLDTGKTVSFDFGEVEKTHWLSGYSYNRAKKGGSI